MVDATERYADVDKHLSSLSMYFERGVFNLFGAFRAPQSNNLHISTPTKNPNPGFLVVETYAPVINRFASLTFLG